VQCSWAIRTDRGGREGSGGWNNVNVSETTSTDQAFCQKCISRTVPQMVFRRSVSSSNRAARPKSPVANMGSDHDEWLSSERPARPIGASIRTDFDVERRVQHQVAELEISMDHSLFFQVHQCTRQLSQHIAYFGLRESTALLEHSHDGLRAYGIDRLLAASVVVRAHRTGWHPCVRTLLVHSSSKM